MMAFFRSSSILITLIQAISLITALPTSSITSQFTPFNLVTSVTQGNASYNNLQIIGQHSGAAQNVVVAVSQSTPGLNFTVGGYVLNNTYIDISFLPPSNLPIYSLGLFASGTPIIANVSGTINQGTALNGNAGQETSGFVIDSEGFICYGGSDFPDFQTFTVCGGATLFGGPAENQLLWRDSASVPDLVHCADVRLEVQFP